MPEADHFNDLRQLDKLLSMIGEPPGLGDEPSEGMAPHVMATVGDESEDVIWPGQYLDVVAAFKMARKLSHRQAAVIARWVSFERRDVVVAIAAHDFLNAAHGLPCSEFDGEPCSCLDEVEHGGHTCCGCEECREAADARKYKLAAYAGACHIAADAAEVYAQVPGAAAEIVAELRYHAAQKDDWRYMRPLDGGSRDADVAW